MSNVYPVWWDKTLTIYNKRIDSTTNKVSWTRFVVNNCFWKDVNEVTHISSPDIMFHTRDIICRIPKNDAFLDPVEWINAEDVENHFTLSNGDIIIKGEVTDVVDDYVAGQRSTDLVAKYKKLQGCLEIETFTIDTGIGLCCEHYHVKGA